MMMHERTTTTSATLLAHTDGRALIKMEGSLALASADAYAVPGALAGAERGALLVNLTTTPLTVGHLPFERARAYDHSCGVATRTTSKGGTITLPPHPHAHWTQRSGKLGSSEFEDGQDAGVVVVFFLDLGPPDEVAPVVVAPPPSADRSFVFLLHEHPLGDGEQPECRRVDPEGIKRAAVNPTFLLKLPQTTCPVDEVLKGVGAWRCAFVCHDPAKTHAPLSDFNAIFGAWKLAPNGGSFGAPVEQSVLLPPGCSVRTLSLLHLVHPSSNVVHGSVTVGARSCTLHFKVYPQSNEGKWSVALVVDVADEQEDALSGVLVETVPNADEILTALVSSACANPFDPSASYRMMCKTPSYKEAFSRSVDVERMWMACVDRDRKTWDRACVLHDTHAAPRVRGVDDPALSVRLFRPRACSPCRRRPRDICVSSFTDRSA